MTTRLLAAALLLATATGFASTAAFPAQASEGIQYNPPSHLDKIDERRTGPLDNRYRHVHTGGGVVVYIVDSGVNIHHIDLSGRAGIAYDPFVTPQLDTTGHGTHVAGIAGGAVSGVAKGVTIRSVRVKDHEQITEAHLVAGLQAVHHEVTSSKLVYRAVVNMSLDPRFLLSAAVRTEVERLIAANVVVVFAAGNSPISGNRDICQSIPDIAGVYMVGNGDVGGIAYNSYGGPCIDAYAPGNSILSASATDNTAYVALTGTSQSAPQAAGIAALILDQYPTLSVSQVVDRINARAVVGAMNQSNGTWVPGSNNRLLYSLPYNE